MRNQISEAFSEPSSLQMAVDDLQSMMAFMLAVRHPALLISYEKAVQNRPGFVDGLIDFCGLRVSSRIREKMISAIEPDRQDYLDQARRQFEGYIDRFEDGVLYGWCRQVGSNDPVVIDVLVNARVAASVAANVFRPDLLAAGHGSGEHAFQVDLKPHVRTGRETIEAAVQGRMFRLMRHAQ